MRVSQIIFLVSLIAAAVTGCYSPTYKRSSSSIVNARSYGEIATEPAVEITPNSSLALEEAINISKQNNPSLKSTWLAITAAKRRKMQAYAAYYPQLSYGGSYNKTHNSSSPYASLTGETDTISNSISAQLILFDGFAREISLKMAEKDIHSRKQAYNDAHRRLSEAVKLQFFRVILAEGNYQVAKENLEFQMRVLGVSQEKFKLKLVRIDEVLNFEANVNQAQDSVIFHKNAILLEREILAKLLGINSFDSSVKLVAEKIPDFRPKELEVYLNLALNHRPDLEQQRILIDIARYRIDQESTANLPSVRLNSSYSNYESEAEPTIDRSVGIDVTWNLFNGFYTRYKVKEAEALLNQQEMSMEITWFNVAAEVKIAYLKLQRAYERIEHKKKLVELSRRRRDLVEKRYKMGVVSVTLLNDAQRLVSSAQGEYNQIEINIHESIAQLNAAVGVE